MACGSLRVGLVGKCQGVVQLGVGSHAQQGRIIDVRCSQTGCSSSFGGASLRSETISSNSATFFGLAKKKSYKDSPLKFESRLPEYDLPFNGEHALRPVMKKESGERADLSIVRRSEIPFDQANLMTPSAPTSLPSMDWRSFRAQLCFTELSTTDNSSSDVVDSERTDRRHWAHRLSTPETGCLLVAKEKLKHHAFLRDSVILMLGFSETRCHGIIVNRSCPFSADSLQEIDQGVVLGLSGCSFQVGGPLKSASTAHVLSKRKDLRGFNTLIPGLLVGGAAALPSLVSSLRGGGISPNDVRVYAGQMEWEASQLIAELDVFDWWDVAACSSQTLLETPPANLLQKLRSLID